MLSLTFRPLYVSALVHFYTEKINVQLNYVHTVPKSFTSGPLVEVRKCHLPLHDNQIVSQVASKPARSKTAANLKRHSGAALTDWQPIMLYHKSLQYVQSYIRNAHKWVQELYPHNALLMTKHVI